jgi:hypothetical protein
VALTLFMQRRRRPLHPPGKVLIPKVISPNLPILTNTNYVITKVISNHKWEAGRGTRL